MADSNFEPTRATPDLRSGADGEAIMSKERARILIEATWEAEALHDLMATALQRISDEEDGLKARWQIGALLRRMSDLNLVVMSGLDDEMESTASLSERVVAGHPELCRRRVAESGTAQ